MVRWKQIFGMSRHFVVAYQYQLEDGVNGQGSLTTTMGGGVYINVNELIKLLEPTVGGEIKLFLILNVIELNKKDFTFYQDHYTLSDKA
jgi:hypothetical protein